MCTSFRMTAVDGSVCIGRSMEFPDMIGAMITAIPRGVTFTSTSPHGAGFSWTTTQGVVGMDAIGNPQYLTDGMNEAGLYAGVLYMPGFASYEDPAGKDATTVISNMDVCNFVLTTCTSVQEAFARVAELTVWGQDQATIGGVPPIHLVLHDSTGDSGVIEFENGAQQHRPNPIGVATNAPYLDWHYNNLRQYMPGIHAMNPEPTAIAGVQLAALSQGTGRMGVPGDGSSPSRFISAATYVRDVLPAANAAAQEMTVLHTLNNFDIPNGAMQGTGVGGRSQNDQTTWVSISSLSAKRYIVRVQTNPTPVVVDLATTDFSGDQPRQVTISDGAFTPLSL